MNDFNFSDPFKKIPLPEKPKNPGPFYLINFENPEDKNISLKFVTVKLDEYSHMIKFVGVELSSTDVENIDQRYLEIVESPNKETFKEYMIPWSRVYNIRSLSFKKK